MCSMDSNDPYQKNIPVKANQRDMFEEKRISPDKMSKTIVSK